MTWTSDDEARYQVYRERCNTQHIDLWMAPYRQNQTVFGPPVVRMTDQKVRDAVLVSDHATALFLAVLMSAL